MTIEEIKEYCRENSSLLRENLISVDDTFDAGYNLGGAQVLEALLKQIEKGEK